MIFRNLLFLFCVFAMALSAHSQVITTFAGGGTGTSLGDGGPATAAKLGLTSGMAIAKNGDVYLTDGNNYRIRKVDFITGIITTIAGTGVSGYYGDGIAATAAKFTAPGWIQIDSADNLYINDDFRIRKIDAITGVISTLTGSGTSGFSGDGGPATAATNSGGISTCDTFGNIYFSDPHNYRIRKINNSGVVNTIAGIGIATSAGDGGAAVSATMQPFATYADIHGNLWFSDLANSVRKIVRSTGIVTRIAGTGDTIGTPYSGDGISATSCHITPIGISVDFIGNLYIADQYNQRVEQVDTSGIIRTIAGTGTSGFSGDGGPATAAKLSYPQNVVLDLCGNVYIADFNNKRIRKITYPANPIISISSVTNASIGSAVAVTASINGAGGNYSINWYNKGILFATTTTPSVSYTKVTCADSITAKIYGCSDSAVSNLKVVRCNVGLASPAPSHRGVTVYPNPVGGELIIAADGEKIDNIVITNLIGQVVFKQAGNSQETVKVDMRGWSSALYFVKVACLDASGGRVYVERVVKE
jgi:hypothetical protein